MNAQFSLPDHAFLTNGQTVPLANSYWQLLIYKLRHVGVRNTMRVASLDVLESFLCSLAKRFPSFPYSARSIQIECTTRCNLKCTMCEIS